MNYLGTSGSIIADAVTALGMLIAFYYGLTGFACAWYYRKNLDPARETSGCRASCRRSGG
jgi:hypothetical protein